MKKALWIAWENQVRNKSMAAALGIPLYMVDYKGNRVMRYLVSLVRTVGIILKETPQVVFVQNPSIVLNYQLLIMRPLFRFKLVSDAHFGGVVACNESKLFQKSLDVLNRYADAVIITNQAHMEYIESLGGRAFICQDPMPEIDRYSESIDENEKNVFFICSYDVDEPFKTAFDAAKILWDEGYRFHVSGNYHKAGIKPYDYPHVHFLGYVSTPEYYRYLYRSQVILDLTKYDNCLVCGAYEAMAAERPLVTSRQKALMSYFDKGTVFTSHDPQSIAQAVRYAYEKRNTLREDIKKWKPCAVAAHSNRVQEIRRFFLEHE